MGQTNLSEWHKRWNNIIVVSLSSFAFFITISTLFLQIAALFLVIGLIGVRLTDRARVWVVPPMTWTLLAFVLVALLSILFAPYTRPLELMIGIKKLRFILYYFIVFYALFQTRSVRIPLYSFIAGCLISALLGWAQHFWGAEAWVQWFHSGVEHLPMSDSFRAVGFQAHHRRFAIGIGLALPMVVALWIHLKVGWKKHLIFPILALILAGAVIFANGRGELFAMLLSALLIPWVRSVRIGIITTVVVILSLLTLYLAVPKQISWFNIDAFTFTKPQGGVIEVKPDEHLGLREKIFRANNNVRVALWLLSWDLFKKHPLLGIGWGGFQHQHDRIEGAAQGVDRYPHRHPHNEFIWIAVETGVVGFSIFCFFWVSLFVRFVRAYRKREGLTQLLKAVLYGGGWSLLFWVIGALTDVQMLNHENAAALWFILGVSSFGLYMKKRPHEVEK